MAGNNNRQNMAQKWMLVGIYPLILSIILCGVLLGGWLSGLSDSTPTSRKGYTGRVGDDSTSIANVTLSDLDDVKPDEIVDIPDIPIIDEITADDEDDEVIDDVIDEDDEDIDEDDTIEEDEEDTADDEESEEDNDEEEENDEILAAQENAYFFAQMNEEDQNTYLQYYKSCLNRDGFYRTSCSDVERLRQICLLVYADHPEFFYVAPSVKRYMQDGVYYVSPLYRDSYKDNEELINTRMQMNEQIANEIIASMPSGLSQYESVKYLYQYLVDHTDYVLDVPDNQEFSSVFLNHESVCAGYAKAMQYLLQKIGIQAMYVTSETHAWNIVQIDGKYYNLDVTWADPMSDDAAIHPDYAYLLYEDNAKIESHSLEEFYTTAPACNSMDANFYVMENLYVTSGSINETDLAAMFKHSQEICNGVVHLMASDSYTYDQLVDYLYGQKHAGAILGRANTFWQNEKTRTLVIK